MNYVSPEIGWIIRREDDKDLDGSQFPHYGFEQDEGIDAEHDIVPGFSNEDFETDPAATHAFVSFAMLEVGVAAPTEPADKGAILRAFCEGKGLVVTWGRVDMSR